MSRPFPLMALCVAAPLVLSTTVAHAQEYNEKTPGYAQAVSAFKAASIVVLGRDLSTKDVIINGPFGPTIGYSESPTGYFTTSEMLQLFAQYDQAAAPNAKIKDGIKFIDAVNFLKAKLKSESVANNKLILILLEKAFTESFGRTFTTAEQSLWIARIKSEGLWYAPIKSELMKQAQVDKKERTALIGRAYGYTLGRAATPEEVKYWLPRLEYYDQIVAANHAWLFSPNGASEYPDVVRRALTTYENNPFFAPLESTVKTWAATFSAGTGKVYAEMLDILQKQKSKK